MDSTEIKTKVLHYWRFNRKLPFCATEAGAFSSDVLVSDGKEIIEIEVKVSLNDLRQEFRKKKHSIYLNYSTYPHRHTPNKFFFAVPRALLGATKTLVRNNPYGIIEVYDTPLSNKRQERFCHIVKKARLIHSKFPAVVHRALLLRMGSELIQYRLRNNPDQIKKILIKFRQLKTKIRLKLY